MRSWILSTFLLLSLVRAIGQKPAESPTPQPAPAQVADDGCANITTVIQAEPDDTFISLFGNNWEAVAACNRFTAVRDGQMMTSPDLLVAGSWIRIPSGTPLTPAAAARAGALEQRRLALLDRLNRLPVEGLDVDSRGLAERCRALLNDNIRFAPDEQFASRELTYLEELAARPARETPSEWLMPVVVAVCGMLLLVLAVVVVKKRRPASALLQHRQARAQAELARVCARAGIRFGP